MGHNKTGVLNRSNREWGSKARKIEDEQRGINNRARRQNIEEQLKEMQNDEQPNL